MNVAVTALLLTGLLACTPTAPADGQDARIRVAVTVAPLADLVRLVAGERAVVQEVVPPGVEPHDAALGPEQIRRVRAADVVVVVGRGFQPAVDEAIGGHPSVVDAARGADGPVGDPHVWLDPVQMVRVVQLVRDALTAADPAGLESYRVGAEGATAMLTELDDAYRRTLRRCATRVLVTSHEAFGHLVARYDLEQHGVTGIEPGTPSDPSRLSELTDLIRSAGIETIFGETDAIMTLARETGVEIGGLQPLEVLDRGDSYDWAMRRNLEILRVGLRCAT